MHDEVLLAAMVLKDRLQSLAADQGGDPVGGGQAEDRARQLEVSEALVRCDRQVLVVGDCLDGSAEGADVGIAQPAAISEHHVGADGQD